MNKHPQKKKPFKFPEAPAGYDYKAVGFLAGSVQTAEDKKILVGFSEKKIPILEFHPQFVWFIHNVQNRPDKGAIVVYPRTDVTSSKVALTVRSLHPETYFADKGIDPDRFFINGLVRRVDESQVVIGIQPSEGDAFHIALKGFLTDAKPGDFWSVEAILKNRRLYIKRGQKVDLPAPSKKSKKPRQEHPASSQTSAKRVKVVSPPKRPQAAYRAS